MKNNRVSWSNDDVGSLCSQFVDSLTECLWYLDGGHNTLASRSLPVPVELSNFQGYNKPESHKHKRKAEKTLEQDFVSEHSLVLLQLTEKSYMKSLRWKSMRVIVLKRVVNLRGYASYLESKRGLQKGQSTNKNISIFGHWLV